MKRLAALAVILALAACAHEPGREFVVFFPADDSTVRPSAQAVISSIATVAAQSRTLRLEVEGQADGGTPKDADLAVARGRAVVAALTDAGVDPARIDEHPSPPVAGEVGLAAHKVVVRLVSPDGPR